MTERPRAKTGRPRKDLSEDQIGQVEKLAAVLTQEQIADFLGISDVTLRQRIKDDPRVSAAYLRGRARAFAGAGQTLLKQGLNGNSHALIFYLKAQAKWKETNVNEHAGIDGGPLTVTVTRKIVQP
jgi:hypothetical protein